MSAEQLATRLLAEQAEVSGDRIRRGDIGQKDFDRFYLVSRELQSLPIHIDDTPAITLSAMRTRCRRLKQRAKALSLVVVDYLQLMRPSVGTKPENRVLEISQITQGLKALVKELAVPVLALSQLSRAVEGREDKRPQLSDLRESGTIEQDADVVMFVYRDEYYIAQWEPKIIAFDNEERFQSAHAKWQSDCSSKPSSLASPIWMRSIRGSDKRRCWLSAAQVSCCSLSSRATATSKPDDLRASTRVGGRGLFRFGRGLYRSAAGPPMG